MQEQSKYDNEYVAPDASVLYHENDDALTPIRLSLPSPPRFELIDGYGLPAKDQVFKRHEVPSKLKRLEEISLEEVKKRAEGDQSYTATYFKVQQAFWKTLEEKRDYYEDEIKWIKRTWWHIVNGYWFFNNGKPTYLTGFHYYYLNFWHIDGQFLPQYRDRDRREFIFFQYAYTTTETFEKLDKNGIAIAEPDGSYKMVDLGKRICFGVGQNKNRRSGNTNKGLLMAWVMASTHKGTDGSGVMSMSGESSEEHMKRKLIPAWRKMPIFCKPLVYTNPTTSIRNEAPKTELGVEDMGNAITAAGTSEANFYDGKKLWFILVDESGKAKNLDVRERTGVLKHCIAQGNGSEIFGLMYQPSTAEDLSKGGKAYKGLLDDSWFYKRDKITGQTVSGMFRLFMPADEALDGYIDKYGYSVKGDKLTKEWKEQGFRATATQHLKSNREQLQRDSKTNPAASINLRLEKKQFPLSYDDSWVGGTGDIGFDYEILDQQLAELSRMDEPARRGNIVWSGTRFGSHPEWVPDPVNGKWYVSKFMKHQEVGMPIKDWEYDSLENTEREVYKPRYPNRFTCGADPFNFKKDSDMNIDGVRTAKSNSRLSDGGIAVFWHRDYSLDPEDKNVRDWESNRFVCTYRYRESDDDKYAEDVLLTCLYYGAMCFPEVNIKVVWKKFLEWGYGGFLKYDIDKNTMKGKDYPGVNQLDRSKQEGFNLLRTHIALHGHREMHEDLITEWRNIQRIEDMNSYDLLAASLCALLGEQSIHAKLEERDNEDLYDLGSAYNY